jgi:hypothetical protein
MLQFNRSGIALIGLFGILASQCFISAFGSAFAEEEPYARIRAVGSVTVDGNSVREDEIIRDGAEVKTEKDSYADIEIHATNAHLTVNPNSTLILHRPKPNGDESHVLKEGAVRAKVNHRSDRNFKVHTSPSIFGVRGTDFIVTMNPLFNDAEVVVLKGSVEVTSTSDALDAKLVQAGEWAGIGGRYGKKVTDALKVSDSALKTLEKQSSTPGWVSFSSNGNTSKSSAIKKPVVESPRPSDKPKTDTAESSTGVSGNKAE